MFRAVWKKEETADAVSYGSFPSEHIAGFLRRHFSSHKAFALIIASFFAIRAFGIGFLKNETPIGKS